MPSGNVSGTDRQAQLQWCFMVSGTAMIKRDSIKCATSISTFFLFFPVVVVARIHHSQLKGASLQVRSAAHRAAA